MRWNCQHPTVVMIWVVLLIEKLIFYGLVSFSTKAVSIRQTRLFKKNLFQFYLCKHRDSIFRIIFIAVKYSKEVYYLSVNYLFTINSISRIKHDNFFNCCYLSPFSRKHNRYISIYAILTHFSPLI